MFISVTLRYIDREQVISTGIHIIINHTQAVPHILKEKRKEDHKTNETYKLGRAIKNIGYDKFEFEVLEKIKFSDWNAIYDIEQHYMIQYDSINSGWNTRINKQDIHI